jgi:hypothetical protein
LKRFPTVKTHFGIRPKFFFHPRQHIQPAVREMKGHLHSFIARHSGGVFWIQVSIEVVESLP